MNDNIFVIVSFEPEKPDQWSVVQSSNLSIHQCNYRWFINDGPDRLSVVDIKSTIFRWLLMDIYRDCIPEANIHIHPGLLEDFEVYKENNSETIEQHRQTEPINWNRR